MDLIVLMKLSKCKEESSTLQIVICIQYFIRLVYTNLRCVSEAKVYVLLRVVVNFDIYNQVMPNLSIIMMDFLLLKKKKKKHEGAKCQNREQMDLCIYRYILNSRHNLHTLVLLYVPFCVHTFAHFNTNPSLAKKLKDEQEGGIEASKRFQRVSQELY